MFLPESALNCCMRKKVSKKGVGTGTKTCTNYYCTCKPGKNANSLFHYKNLLLAEV